MIGIDEQIAAMESDLHAGDEMNHAILATLRRMKSIEDAARELPEEPQEIKALRGYLHAEINWQIHVRADQLKICAAYIDTLRDLLAAEKSRCKRLEDGLRNMIRAYVVLMENGRDRIKMLGGECDSLDVMERADPNLREAKALL